MLAVDVFVYVTLCAKEKKGYGCSGSELGGGFNAGGGCLCLCYPLRERGRITIRNNGGFYYETFGIPLNAIDNTALY